MDLLSLRYFQAVARHQHISRAAEELRVAQPSVSRTIIRLEAGARDAAVRPAGAADTGSMSAAPPSWPGSSGRWRNWTTRGGSWPMQPGRGRGGWLSPPRLCCSCPGCCPPSGRCGQVKVRLFQAPVDSMRQHLRSARWTSRSPPQPLAGLDAALGGSWCGRRCGSRCRPAPAGRAGACGGGRAGG
ncbi:LysR family transcriptional regulator [Streptomyces tricolor]|nr:LysR family transcriptional regulator [Streptomyces tricolor]